MKSMRCLVDLFSIFEAESITRWLAPIGCNCPGSLFRNFVASISLTWYAVQNAPQNTFGGQFKSGGVVHAKSSWAGILVFSLVSATVTSCTSLFVHAQDDPFNPKKAESTRSDTQIDAQIWMLQQTPVKIFDGVIDSDEVDLKFDIGTVGTNREYRIKLRLRNSTRDSFLATKLSASCGCVAGLPANLKLVQGDIVPVRVLFRSPNKPEQLEKVIRIVDESSNRTIRISLLGTAKNEFDAEIGSVIFDKPGRKQLAIQVKRNFGDEDLSSLRFNVAGTAVYGYRFVAKSPSEGILEIDAGSDGGSDASISDQINVTAWKNAWECVLTKTVNLDYAFRGETRPSRLLLRKNGESRQYAGKIVILKHGLVSLEEKTKKENWQIEFVNEEGQSNSVIECEVRLDYLGPSSTLVVVSLSAESADNIPTPALPNNAILKAKISNSQNLPIPVFFQ